MLTTFILSQSRLDARKLKILIKSICNLPLATLELSSCQLNDENCGKAIGAFLMKNETLKSLELKGNYLETKALEAIGYGLRQFRGTLDYIGWHFLLQ